MSQLSGKTIAIVGAGNMGGALITGLVESGLLPPDSVTAVDIDLEILESHRSRLGVTTCTDARVAVSGKDLVVLSLKPQIWEAVLKPFTDQFQPTQLVISIMGGVQGPSLESVLGRSIPVVRAMPNISALVGASITAIAGGRHATEVHLDLAEAVLNSVGETVRLQESQMDAVTGLSGSGPAYVYAVIDALADGGVKAGLPKPVALRLSAQTVFGAAKMVMESGEHPSVLKDRVTTPGGTTIAGLAVMEERGVRAALMAAVEAATKRSEELGQ
jgi:pyrroline-5-carboxylate reductase